MIYTLYRSLRVTAWWVRSTASRPERVHSARRPICWSILDTLSQVLKSSSTTNARQFFSSGMDGDGLSDVHRRKEMFTMNSVPAPCRLFTSMAPFIISTMFLVIAMPRPVPWMPLVVEFRSRSKGSKMWATNSSLMPMPVSLMANS